jgi:hypothetical protein
VRAVAFDVVMRATRNNDWKVPDTTWFLRIVVKIVGDCRPGSGDPEKSFEADNELFRAQWIRSLGAAGISKTGEVGCG